MRIYYSSITKKSQDLENQSSGIFQQRYQDSNLGMTESESVALPLGDSAMCFVFVSLQATRI